MFGIKTVLTSIFYSKFEKILEKDTITKQGLSFIDTKVTEIGIVRKLKNENRDDHIQAPVAQFTHPISRKIIKKIIAFNPNNLGNWSEDSPFHLSGKLEQKVIEQIKNVLTSKNENLGGYITSGGTEANIFMMWLGKKKMKKKYKTEKIVVLKTSLTHYSINKAADINELDIKNVSLSSKTWGMDPEYLEKEIQKNYKNGKRGFIIPLTMGYTITGSDDPVKKINDVLVKIKKQTKDIEFFCWIDAAFSGIINLFSKKSFDPFFYKNINGYITDFHKFPAFPYPSGVVIYRKNLIKNIQKKVAYIGMNDTTVLGSRSGIMSIMTWYGFNLIGKVGFTEMITKSLQRKEKYLNDVKNKIPNVTIITDKNSVQAGIVVKNKKEKAVIEKMGLEPTKQKMLINGKNTDVSIYKLYFLPFFK